MMYKKKRDKPPKTRFLLQTKVNEEMDIFARSLLKEMRVPYSHVLFEALSSLLEKKKYVMECIWANDYSIVYRNKNTNGISLNPTKPHLCQKMYIFHIDLGFNNKYRIYFKDELDDSYNFNIWVAPRSRLSKKILSSFPETLTSIRKEIPLNE